MHKFIKLLIIILFIKPSLAWAHAISVEESLLFITSSSEYVEITANGALAIDLKYASSNNFVGENLYGNFNKAFLHQIAAKKLSIAVKNLESYYPKFKLIIFDAIRPRSIQYRLWEKVKGTDQQKYVANPKGGSIHNFGFALDLSILDETGNELDMGTPYDDFTELAQPRLEEGFLVTGKLSKQQIKNRRLLRKIMEDAGFTQLPLEWWHFDALPKPEVKAKFKIVE